MTSRRTVRKLVFKPRQPEFAMPGHNTVEKSWDVLLDGNLVGTIHSTIRDLWMDRSNPGYSVTVDANLSGREKPFREYSAAFSNRSAKEARENRSIYVRRAKAWAKKHFETVAQVKP